MGGFGLGRAGGGNPAKSVKVNLIRTLVLAAGFRSQNNDRNEEDLNLNETINWEKGPKYLRPGNCFDTKPAWIVDCREYCEPNEIFTWHFFLLKVVCFSGSIFGNYLPRQLLCIFRGVLFWLWRWLLSREYLHSSFTVILECFMGQTKVQQKCFFISFTRSIKLLLYLRKWLKMEGYSKRNACCRNWFTSSESVFDRWLLSLHWLLLVFCLDHCTVSVRHEK